MNDILTNKGTQANKIFGQNMVSFTLLTATLLALFSSGAFANRPAMEDRSDVNNGSDVINEASETTSASRPDTQAESQPEVQQETSSAVDIMMMQQQTQQTQQTMGDIVQLPAKEMQAGETIRIKLLDYPHRGMDMDKVQYRYGQPIAISESVGKPPITRWTYSDRVVYFEYSTVLHVVAR